MKRACFTAVAAISVMLGTSAVFAESDADLIRIPASEAVLEGVALKGTENEKEITYSPEDDCILNLGEYATAAYQIPEVEEDTYDIYLEISKGSNAFVSGSTPVTVTVNDGKTIVPSVPLKPCGMDQMGMDGNPTYQQDTGLFLMESDIALASGDTVTIGGVPGYEFYYNESYSSSMPAIGDLVICKAGTEVEQGYADSTFTEKDEEADTADPLSGLKIAWLGSSVTYGQGAGGYSMADAIAENHAATVSYKYAISGTTLSDCMTENSLAWEDGRDHGSYVYRMEQLDKDADYDLFIIQLSTNDATAGIPMGEISADQELSSQDTSTVIGAMEYIIAYVKETWNCPVMFFTGTKYDSEQYQEMVETLLALQEKWQIGVIDLWNNEEMNAIDQDLYLTYMKEDGIHPLRDGYEKWWAPEFEKEITEYLSEN